MTPSPNSEHQQMMAYLRHIAKTAASNSSPLRRFLWRYERTRDNQDDIIQEAILQALRSSNPNITGASVQTWFYGVLSNVARHHVARQVKHSTRVESTDLWQDDGERLGAPADGANNPEEAAQCHQLILRLIEAMQSLPPRLRSTLELVCLDDHSYLDAAQLLDVPVGTVRSRINRARMLLRRQLRMAPGASVATLAA